jgi:hypothetical protein
LNLINTLVQICIKGYSNCKNTKKIFQKLQEENLTNKTAIYPMGTPKI